VFTIDVEETLHMINYIKEQHAKGFSADEIKKKLLDAGWSKNDVDKYVTEYVLKGGLGAEKSVTIELFAKYGKFLLEGEVIKGHYHAGNFHVVITDQRAIFLKKFPKNLKEFNFKDLELVEYYTMVDWLKCGYAVFYLVFFLLFLRYHHFFWMKIVQLIPPAAEFLNFKLFWNVNVPAAIILIYLLVMFFRDAYRFIASFFGKLRILPKKLGPFDIVTSMTSDVEKVIQILEEKIELYKEK